MLDPLPLEALSSGALSPAAKVATWLLVGVPVALSMEGWARMLHGRLWHGPLWGVHRSHHEPRAGRLERNDVFALVHAVPAVALILYGCVGAPGLLREAAFGLGLGMTAFGAAYATVHDGLVHGRLPVGFLRRFKAMRRIEAAHKVHHRRDGPPYGLFLGPRELRRR